MEVTKPVDSWKEFKTLLDKGLLRVLDVEVEVNNFEDYSAFVPENRLMYVGIAGSVAAPTTAAGIRTIHTIVSRTRSPMLVFGLRAIAGHNIKYDVHWLMRTGNIRDGRLVGSIHWDNNTVGEALLLNHMPVLYDTQLVEYLLTGQRSGMSSLDELAAYYGLPLKPASIKKGLEEGKKITDFPEEDVIDYLNHDLQTTYSIVMKQVEQIDKRPPAFQQLVISQLNMLRLVTLMEWNGLCLDTTKCLDFRKTLELEVDNLEIKAADILKKLLPSEVVEQENPLSPTVQSKLLFGGTYTYTRREVVGTTRDGRDKLKKVEHTYHHPAMPELSAFKSLFTIGKSGKMSVDEESLNKCLHLLDTSAALWGRDAEVELTKDYIRVIIEYRDKSKLLNTYVSKLPTLLRTPANSLIHHNLNQCVTATGRLSASKPNTQNRPPEVTKLFKSRYNNGFILSLDFKQIEICALAQLCKDPQLVSDLCAGVDIHYVLGLKSGAYPHWKDKPPSEIPHNERRDVKSVVFGSIYGGGAAGIARNSGVPLANVKVILEAIYERYPEVKRWHTDLIKTVEANKFIKPHAVHSDGSQVNMSVVSTETGRLLTFETFDEVKSYAKTRFSPTQIKNYPVQSLATGDWVPMLLPLIADFLQAVSLGAYQIVPINTTHDDMELDFVCQKNPGVFDTKTYAVWVQDKVNKWLERQMPDKYKEWTGMPLLVPIKVEAKVVERD